MKQEKKWISRRVYRNRVRFEIFQPITPWKRHGDLRLQNRLTRDAWRSHKTSWGYTYGPVEGNRRWLPALSPPSPVPICRCVEPQWCSSWHSLEKQRKHLGLCVFTWLCSKTDVPSAWLCIRNADHGTSARCPRKSCSPADTPPTPGPPPAWCALFCSSSGSNLSFDCGKKDFERLWKRKVLKNQFWKKSTRKHTIQPFLLRLCLLFTAKLTESPLRSAEFFGWEPFRFQLLLDAMKFTSCCRH